MTVISYMDDLINALDQFGCQSKTIDSVHNDYLTNFQNIVGQLLSPDANFQGATATAISDAVSNYVGAASALSDNGTGTSDIYADASKASAKAGADLEARKKELHDWWFFPEIELIMLPGRIDDIMKQWSDAMHKIKYNVEPSLPATPTIPDKLQPPTNMPVQTGLTDPQKQLVNDIIADLTADGVTFDQREIEDLVRAGYGRDAIKAIIKMGWVNDWTGKSYTNLGDGHYYVAHADQHIGVPASQLIATTSRKNKSTPPGKGKETTFYGNASAQDAMRFAFAQDPNFAALVNAGVPNTSYQSTVCDTSHQNDWGFGYVRGTPTIDGVYPAPTLRPHLDCVFLWIAIDQYGKPFVVDTYPT